MAKARRSAAACSPSSSQLGLVIVFALYSIAFEAIVWGLFGWAVFVQDRSGWWVLVALFLSGAQLRPKHFGIRQPIIEENVKHTGGDESVTPKQ
jgi:hypothetical protein